MDSVLVKLELQVTVVISQNLVTMSTMITLMIVNMLPFIVNVTIKEIPLKLLIQSIV